MAIKLWPTLRSFVGFGWYPAELTDTSLHGNYIGINPIIAGRGGSLEESTTSFSLDERGVLVGAVIDDKEFQISYDPSWVFHLTGWGVDECLAVRQHESSNLAQFILGFTHPWCKLAPSDAVMLLGEGMPAVLGVFVKKSYDHATERFLKKTYKEFYQPKNDAEKTSWLEPIDLVEAAEIMNLENIWWKVDVLKKAASNLWIGTESEIRDRINLIDMGLRDPNPRVQEQALEAFILGGRVTAGVELVVRFIEEYESRDKIRRWSQVQKKMLEAATCLLYEAYNFNKEIAYLQNEFGTTDVGEIHEKTKGVLTPEQFKTLDKVAGQRPQTKWTTEHYQNLRKAIKGVTCDIGRVLPENIQKGERALRDYFLPELVAN